MPAFMGVSVKKWGSNCFKGSINFEKDGAWCQPSECVWARHRGRERHEGRKIYPQLKPYEAFLIA